MEVDSSSQFFDRSKTCFDERLDPHMSLRNGLNEFDTSRTWRITSVAFDPRARTFVELSASDFNQGIFGCSDRF